MSDPGEGHRAAGTHRQVHREGRAELPEPGEATKSRHRRRGVGPSLVRRDDNLEAQRWIGRIVPCPEGRALIRRNRRLRMLPKQAFPRRPPELEGAVDVGRGQDPNRGV